MAYTWSCLDVMSLLNVKVDARKAENIIRCPFCGGKRFAMNIQKGTGHCFNCDAKADSASYYAAETGMSLNDARNDIKRRLNITDSNNKPIYKKEEFVAKPEENIAEILNRDRAYKALLNELSLSKKNYEDLIKRGFSQDDIEEKMYRTYPDKEDFEAICRRIQQKGISLKGVPGFYKDNNGNYTMPKLTKGILIPQKNINNLIEGLQLRKDEDLRRRNADGDLEAKIVWLSTKNYSHGAGANVSLHISTDFRYDREQKKYIPILHGNRVTLTEGGMKADLCCCLLNYNGSFIAVPGIYALKPLENTLKELKTYGLKSVNVAFDMDYLSNKHVKDAMEKVTEIIKKLGLQCENIMNWQYEVKNENESFYLKGLDDYLAYQFKGIIPKVAKK